MEKAPETNHTKNGKARAGLLAWPAQATIRVRQTRNDPHTPRKVILEEQLASLRREHDKLQQALFEAAQLQRKLCAPREMRRGGFEIASEIFPVRHISGDFYDVLDLGAALGLAVGDIAGKGLAAGLWFTHVVGLIRAHTNSSAEPGETLAAINQNFCQLGSEPPFVSLFMGRLDPRTGELIYCNAGQPPTLLLRRDGRVELLREGGPILGAVPQATFLSGRIALGAGDTLIAYSDGIVECRNAKDEEFGTERLLAAASSFLGSSASTMLFSLLGAVQDFAGRHPRQDDFALMVARRPREKSNK